MIKIFYNKLDWLPTYLNRVMENINYDSSGIIVVSFIALKIELLTKNGRDQLP